MNSLSNSDNNKTDDLPSVGATLKKQRLKNDWSIEDVASTLNLSNHTIIAIEEDNYQLLPGTTFTKGYIRSYANLLGLDAKELTKNIKNTHETFGELPTNKIVLKSKIKKRTKKKKKGFLKLLFWLIVLVFIAVFFVSKTASIDNQKLAEFFKLPFLNTDTTEQQFPINSDSNESNNVLLNENKASENTNNEASHKTTNSSDKELIINFE